MTVYKGGNFMANEVETASGSFPSCLVDEKLEKVNDKDLWCLAKLLAWTFEARKGKKISVRSAFDAHPIAAQEKAFLRNRCVFSSDTKPRSVGGHDRCCT